MTARALFVLIIVISTFIVGISVAGFVIFSRFLAKEKERGERFREIHLPPKE